MFVNLPTGADIEGDIRRKVALPEIMIIRTKKKLFIFMKPMLLIYLFSAICFFNVCNVSGQNINESSLQSNIIAQKENDLRLSKLNDSVYLNTAICADTGMMSVLEKISNSSHNRKMFYYIAFLKVDNVIYFNVIGDLNNYNLVELGVNRKSEYNYFKEGTNILGYLNYKGHDFYMLSYPAPYNINHQEINCMIKITNEKIKIKEEGFDELIIYENPQWLYQYSDKKITLLNSLNE